MKISVITPCFNSEKYISATIKSVLGQTALINGDIQLEYIICDGASSDQTVSIIKSFNHPAIQVFSEKDKGMYEALSKGLERCSGDVVCYINAGDMYFSSAFSVISKIFNSYNYIQFLTGRSTVINLDGEILESSLPFMYRSELLMRGYYGTKLPFVQQESTFWRKNLITSEIINELKNYKLAGDLYLWTKFIEKASLYIVDSQLGAFRIHPGQLSENKQRYFAEASKFLGSQNIFNDLIAFKDSLIWKLPPNLKKKANSAGIINYDLTSQKWTF
jgi:glycosyltransferase involved in cell wall biosynthesis